MSEVSLVNTILISFPEELLIMLMTLLAIGRRDLVKVTNLLNLWRLVNVTIITAIFSVILNKYFSFLLIVNIIKSTFFIFTYFIIFRIEVHKIIRGFFIAVIFTLIFEVLGSQIMTIITQINYNDLSPHSMMYVVFTIPGRLLQILTAFILYKAPFTLIKSTFIAYSRANIKKFALQLLIIVGCFSLSTYCFENLLMQVTTSSVSSLVSTVVGVGFSIAVFFSVFIDIIENNKKVDFDIDSGTNVRFFNEFLAEHNNNDISNECKETLKKH